MKKIYVVLFLLPFLFISCEKTETVPLNLKGTLKGYITTRDEFGKVNNDSENIIIELEGSDPLLSFITDSTGVYEINEIPTGTYNVIISKEGYGEYQNQGVQIVGGSQPIHFHHPLIQQSNTIIKNLSLEIVNNSDVYFKCTVNNMNMDDDSEGSITFFYHTESNPSDSHYLDTYGASFRGVGDVQLEHSLYIDDDLFPSGSTVYVIAYGCYSGLAPDYYDILSNVYRGTSLGEASNIASIKIP